MAAASESPQTLRFETHPERYAHWKVSYDGPVARLAMDVQEDKPLRPGYPLKLNSYDLGVDIELADFVERLRFEHPEVKVVVVTSAQPRIFCAGANIYMLGSSTHGFKVNFCKFTNETRNYLEEASALSGQRYVAALNGVASGGGYELALACDRILLADDGNSAVSFPETPLLAVLPGTGGLTRLVDKRKVRRDLADVFSTLAEGVRGKRAEEWGLVDRSIPKSKFDAFVREHAEQLAAEAPTKEGAGITLGPLSVTRETRGELVRSSYTAVELEIDRKARTARLLVKAPEGAPATTSAALREQGDQHWHLRAFRELDDALLDLRFNHPEIGLVLVRTSGDAKAVLEHDEALAQLAPRDWLAREIVLQVKRVLKRMDLTAKSFFAIAAPGSAFAGVLLELALAADRTYMLDGELEGEGPAGVAELSLSALNFSGLPMSNGLTRLETRFLATPARVAELSSDRGPFDAAAAQKRGLVTVAPDAIDWDDEVRIAIEERASLSPDALTGMEASLRFAGPETMETKIFGRLTAWQNWIFQRPNAVGERGALTLYGRPERPEFDWRRT